MSDDSKAYTIWSVATPFRKDGTPVMGNMGSTIKSVVVMESATFKRILAEHPSLQTAQFNVGTFD